MLFELFKQCELFDQFPILAPAMFQTASPSKAPVTL